MRAPLNLTGQTFGALKVLRMVKVKEGTTSVLKTRAECRCECGSVVLIRGSNLRCGNNTSCGCRANLNRKLLKGGYGGITGNVWNRIKDGARQRNFKFTIKPEYCWNLFVEQKGRCKLSGLSIYLPKNGKEYHNLMRTASLDRIDSRKGYVVGNVQWVHRDINRLKMDLPEDRFIELCKLVANNLSGDTIKT